MEKAFQHLSQRLAQQKEAMGVYGHQQEQQQNAFQENEAQQMNFTQLLNISEAVMDHAAHNGNEQQNTPNVIGNLADQPSEQNEISFKQMTTRRLMKKAIKEARSGKQVEEEDKME